MPPSGHQAAVRSVARPAWLPLLPALVGDTDGAPLLKVSAHRSARFYVRGFRFQGVQLSWLHEGEDRQIAAMLGAPIDPELLLKAPSVEEALSAIARNTSSLIAGGLAACQKSPAVAKNAPPSPVLAPLWPPEPDASHPRSLRLAPASVGHGVTDPAQPEPHASHPRSLRLPPASVGHGVAPGALDPAPEPTSLLELPTALVSLIVCFTGSSRAAEALACTCHALAAKAGRADGTRAAREVVDPLPPIELYPVWSAPAQGSCPASIISYDDWTGALRKTARLGNSIVLLGDPVYSSTHRGGLLELRLSSLRSVCGVQLGVTGLGRKQADALMRSSRNDSSHRQSRSPGSGHGDGPGMGVAEGACRYWCDGAGRVRVLDGQRCAVHCLHGEMLREGDTLGAAVFTLRRRTHLAFVLNGALMGEPIPLPTHYAAWRFFVTLDPIEGNEVSLCAGRRRAPLALASLLLSGRSYVPRPLGTGPGGGARVLVRTVGPISRGFHVEIQGVARAGDATVDQVALAVCRLMGCDAWHQLELRLGRLLLTPSRLDATDPSGLQRGSAGGEGERTLSEVGLSFHPTSGTQSQDLLASFPHLFS